MTPLSRMPLRLACAVLLPATSLLWPARASAALDQAALNALFDGTRAAKPTAVVRGKAAQDELDVWLASERGIALKKMFANISPAGAAPGSVAASPSRENPNYWYNWKRDAALTMSEVAALYRGATDPKQKQAYLQTLLAYAAYARGVQGAGGLTGIGEPKSNMDGTPFNGPWGRPQDDGPAEEASTLISVAASLLAQGQRDQALALYGDFTRGIKGDLEYVAHHWQQTSFDVWEEVKAHHFDSEMAQQSALREGAWLARKLGDPGAADFYEAQAKLVDQDLAAHWDAKNGIIRAATDRDGGLDYKASGLDTAVILAAIRRQPVDAEAAPDAPFSVTDKRVLATARALQEAFKNNYALNNRSDAPGVAIGRYPEDQYFGGNPWVLCTDAFAQLYYMAATAYLRKGAVSIEAEDLAFFQDLVKDPIAPGMALKAGEPAFSRLIAALKEGGDAFLRVVRAHANADGSLSEQIDRRSGYMTSARDLTWNYASVLTALDARDELLRALRPSNIR